MLNGAKIMLVAVEPSGDALGAALIESLMKKGIAVEQLIGCGGPLMQAQGFKSAFSTERLAVMGFSDVVRILPEVKKRIGQLAGLLTEDHQNEKFTKQTCIAVIFIDGWGFSRLAAEKFRNTNPSVKLYKYVAPQIWASRPGRINFVKKYFDGVLTLFPFEPALFENENIPARYAGNSIFQQSWRARGQGEVWRAKNNLQGRPILSVLPGSRVSEIKRLAKPFMETVWHLRKTIKDLVVVMPIAMGMEEKVRMAYGALDDVVFATQTEKYAIFDAANAALATSGTVTTEIAIHATPQVIAYRVDPITALWARMVLKAPYVSILNIMAERMIIPEFLQYECSPSVMAQTLETFFKDDSAAQAQIEALSPILDRLALNGADASDIAATLLLDWIGLEA